VITCWKPGLEEADAWQIAEQLGRPAGGAEVLYYPVWLLTIEVVRRLPLLGASKLLLRGIADGVSGKIAVLSHPVSTCDTDAEPSRILDARLQMDCETERMLEERFIPFVLTRLRSSSMAPSVKIVHAEQVYKQLFRVKVTNKDGNRILYVDTATREYACLPEEPVSEGESDHGKLVLGAPDLA
jgi:hypothetical protein